MISKKFINLNIYKQYLLRGQKLVEIKIEHSFINIYISESSKAPCMIPFFLKPAVFPGTYFASITTHSEELHRMITPHFTWR